MSRVTAPAPVERLLAVRTWPRSLPWRRSQPVSCLEVSAALGEILDGGRTAPASYVHHVETCLGCQAELARYRRLVRLLHQLRANGDVMPPAGVMAEVLASLEDAANRRLIRSLLAGRTVAYGAAGAAAGTAAVGLVVLAVARSGSRRGSATAHEAAS